MRVLAGTQTLLEYMVQKGIVITVFGYAKVNEQENWGEKHCAHNRISCCLMKVGKQEMVKEAHSSEGLSGSFISRLFFFLGGRGS